MIVEEYIKIRVGNLTYKHYNKLGYKCRPLDYIIVKTTDLSIGIRVKINVTCDKCNCVINMNKESYTRECKKDSNNQYFCNTCKGVKKYIERASLIFDNKYDYSLITNLKDKQYIICPIHGKFFKNLRQHTYDKSGCPKCLVRKKKIKDYNTDEHLNRTKILLENFKEIHNNKYNYDKFIFINMQTPSIITCPIHGDFKKEPTSHLNNKGCLECLYDNYRYDRQEYIDKVNNVHNNKYDYSLIPDKYKNGEDKIDIICPIHSIFTQGRQSHLSGTGCPMCGKKSKGEAAIEDFLKNNNISFTTEKTFPTLLSVKNWYLRFDFYLPTYNILIEFDGEQHFNPRYFSKDNKEKILEDFHTLQKNDQIKNEWCLSNNYKLIRFNYKELRGNYFDKILKEKLKDIINI